MLLKADVVANSIDQNVKKGERVIYLSPKGKKFDQKLAQDLSKEKSFSLICGHFEGVDERVLSTRNIEEISIGDYVLSGGETAAFVVLDSVLRLLPGVLGNDKSISEETFENGLLEYPQYTKPQIWEKKSGTFFSESIFFTVSRFISSIVFISLLSINFSYIFAINLVFGREL